MLLVLLGCSQLATTPRVEPSFVEVSWTLASAGSAESPLPFTSEPFSVPVSVRALNVDRSPASDFDGDLTVKVRPGKLRQDDVVTLADGEWSGTLSIANGFGPTRLWFTDEGDRDPDSTRTPGYAAGVTEPIWFAYPTIAELQATTDHETNQLAGEYAELRAVDRQLVVTARDAAGFWATDVADAVGTGNSIYVYTFSRPDEELAEGARLTLLNGIDQEYLGSTQLSFPSTETDGTSLDVPQPIELTGSAACNDDAMELYEASRVRATDWQIPTGFTPDSEDYADFEEYGQWPLQLGGCTVYVESGTTVPDFYPPDHVGQTLPAVEGMLKEIYGKWILVVVDAEDLTPPDGRRRTRTRTLGRP